MSTDLREGLYTLAEQLPTMPLGRERWSVCASAKLWQKARRRAKRGEFASDEDVHHMFNKYGAKT